jgi:hypothetical protein
MVLPRGASVRGGLTLRCDRSAHVLPGLQEHPLVEHRVDVCVEGVLFLEVLLVDWTSACMNSIISYVSRVYLLRVDEVLVRGTWEGVVLKYLHLDVVFAQSNGFPFSLGFNRKQLILCFSAFSFALFLF